MLERICDLKNKTKNEIAMFDGIGRTELTRLIKRRSKSNQQPTKEEVKTLTDTILKLYQPDNEQPYQADTIENFLEALDTCAFIQSKI